MELPAELQQLLASLPVPISPVVLLAGLVLILIVSVIVLRLAFTRRARKVLLVGPPGGGKTALFFKLKTGKDVNTVMSMKENEGNFAFYSERGTGASKVSIIDVPDTRAIVFVVDSVAFRAREAAEHLYELLSQRQVRQQRIPFLVCLNKSDLLSAQSPEAIRAELEREMQAVRHTLKSQPRGEHQGDQLVKVGIDGKDFRFEHVPNKFTWASCSAKGGDTKAVEAFVRRLISA